MKLNTLILTADCWQEVKIYILSGDRAFLSPSYLLKSAPLERRFTFKEIYHLLSAGGLRFQPARLL